MDSEELKSTKQIQFDLSGFDIQNDAGVYNQSSNENQNTNNQYEVEPETGNDLDQIKPVNENPDSETNQPEQIMSMI